MVVLAVRSTNSSTAKASEWPSDRQPHVIVRVPRKALADGAACKRERPAAPTSVKACESNGGAGRAEWIGRHQDSYREYAYTLVERFRGGIEMSSFLGSSDTRRVSWNSPCVLALAASLHIPQIHFHQTSTHLISPTRPPEEIRRVRRRRVRIVPYPGHAGFVAWLFGGGTNSLALVNSQVDHSATSLHLLP